MSLAFMYTFVNSILSFIRIQVELAFNIAWNVHRQTPVDNLLLVLVNRLYFVA